MKLNLTSTRLNLEIIKEEDLQEIHELHLHPEVDKFNTAGIPENIEETRKVIEKLLASVESGNAYVFSVFIASTRQFIGMITLNLGSKKYNAAEVWFKFSPQFWNKGFASESLGRIIQFGFDELNLHRIEAGCAIENFGSIRVLEKAGMKREGHRRKALPLKTGWSDNFEYAILESDFRK
ncbi:GNAT family N-acetyltransferase [Mesonia maritima]|uniref:RimJ/RimL family protein N-acetyltransferase n=1 Tax=Mesonia maritima TaxID=1793873 RepID=A0ABU1K8X7_9FLAO|nr:GNAT family N-acetyltransferase [Mesonia maritima]MDR6302054.1 RimJ/RimL family protein N-acetyltransferase [Mesonia maritima]